MAKVTTLSSTPDAWLPSLERRVITWDPIHAEMIGEEEIEEASQEQIDLPTSYTELVGAELEISVVDSPIQDDVGAYLDAELIGDEEQEEYEEAHEESEENLDDDAYDTPEEGPPEDEGETVQMGPESSEPGTSAPPSFAPVSGPTRMLPARPVNRTAIAQKAIFSFRRKVELRNPAAIRALLQLQVKAQTSPKHAVVFKAVAKPWIKGKVSGHASFRIHGDVFVRGVAKTAGSVIKLALTPAVWVTEGVGTVSKEVGNQLQKLARKL